jgi:hypothetical protein
MSGGLVQLITTGIADAPLTYNPEITFFKTVYKQSTNFAIIQNIKNLGYKNFNSVNTYKIENMGDLLKSIHFVLKIPKFDIIQNTKQNNIINKYYNINQLEIYYSNNESFIFNLNNEYIILPKYFFKLLNFNTNKIVLDSNIIIKNILPEIITISDLPLGFNTIELLEDLKKFNMSTLFIDEIKFSDNIENFQYSFEPFILEDDNYLGSLQDIYKLMINKLLNNKY